MSAAGGPLEPRQGGPSTNGVQVDEAPPGALKGGTMTVPRTGPEGAQPLLEVNDLHVTFRVRGRSVFAVNGLSYSLAPASTLAIIGESCSGKTVASRAIMGLLPPTAEVTGSIRFDGREVVGAKERELRKLRTNDVAMVFQNPERSLNPTMRIGPQVSEAIRLHMDLNRKAAHERTVDLLRRVRLPAPERRYFEYPHQLSGGMRQRVLLAMAVIHHPKILIADEPTTALDVLVQAQILTLIQRLQKATGMATLFITHNLALAAEYADTVLVLYAGRRREYAPSARFFQGPRHPYSRALLDCIPTLGHHPQALLEIPGKAPTSGTQGPGCSFAPRCGRATPECTLAPPPEIGDSHRYLCLHPLDPP